MSLMFKPQIPKSFSFGSGRMQESKSKAVPVQTKSWTNKDLQKLVDLRALGCSFKDCGPLMDRSAAGVAACVNQNDLYSAISKKRKELIAQVIG